MARTSKLTNANKLPDHLMILGQKFRVEVLEDLTSGGEAVSGETVGAVHRIRISADMDTEKQWRTLIHESLHAALHINGYGDVSDAIIEEMIVQTLEYSIVQLLEQHGSTLARVFHQQTEGDNK